ncbi:MAG: 30S ribosomal protein S20 [Candidatus Kapabacteria bacterium]|nr:30S ribosomal protein S20 [Candidatus Kapabacteria bacterium]
MAHHKSALKRIRQTKKLRSYNRFYKKLIREAVKAVRTSVELTDAQGKLTKAMSILDRAAAKRIMHKNTASNRKSSLSRYVNRLKGPKAA